MLQNVGIAIIQKDCKYLISQRRADAHLPGLWEFPGGKQKPNETLEACVIREILEELCIEIKISRFYGKFIYAYSDKTVILHAYLCHITKGIPQSTQKIKWASAKELLSLPFPEANLPMLKALHDGTG